MAGVDRPGRGEEATGTVKGQGRVRLYASPTGDGEKG